MIYQLAKTSTLLSGQVKWDLVLDKTRVSNLQLVPISEHIPFNYYAPEDTMNYSHCDNVKRLYSKIAGDFYTPVVNPNLSVDHLHRSQVMYEDTHENTYEMGMKRMEYHRYSKQFSFFCPFWCDNVNEFNDLRFKIVMKNAKHSRNKDTNTEDDRVLYSSFIDMSYIKQYMQKYFEALDVYPVNEQAQFKFKGNYYKYSDNSTSMYRPIVNVLDAQDNKYFIDENCVVWVCTEENLSNPDLNLYDYQGRAEKVGRKMYDNSDLIYLNFKEYRAWVRGINAEAGIVQTCEASQIINNLTSQERPMLEADNMIANMFAENKLICSQLFNFNFIFNVEDFIPLEFIPAMFGEKVNVYVDIYCGDKKVEVKDLYSNYELIPRYDTATTQYSEEHNALDYLQDNHSIELITKNKLVQSTFHWALKSSQNTMFNIYDGMSPTYNGEERSHGIMEHFSDLYIDKFDEYKNPRGIFNYHNFENVNNGNFASTITIVLKDDDYFSIVDFNNAYDNQWFGDIRINNSKLQKSGYDKIKVSYLRFDNCDLSFVKNFFERNNWKNIDLDNNVFFTSKTDGTDLKIVFIQNGSDTDYIKNTFFYNGFIGTNHNEDKLETLKDILKCADKPDIIMLKKSVGTEHYNSPDINSKEISYVKAERVVYVQRYDLNIIPMFITPDKYQFNNTYYCKQYINTLDNSQNVLDDIAAFNNTSFTTFAPIYPSINYSVINSVPTEYLQFYMNSLIENFQGEYCWYKKNSMFLLPATVRLQVTAPQLTDEMVQEQLYNDMLKNLDVEPDSSAISEIKKVFDNYIYKLYKSTFTFDYASDTDITNYNYEIKYELR